LRTLFLLAQPSEDLLSLFLRHLRPSTTGPFDVFAHAIVGSRLFGAAGIVRGVSDGHVSGSRRRGSRR